MNDYDDGLDPARGIFLGFILGAIMLAGLIYWAVYS